MDTVSFVIIIVAVAFVFDYTNGFHDAANSIATVVSTRVLSPKLAVIWAAFFNFVAAFVFGTKVAKTIGSGMMQVEQVTATVIITGLLGAIVWDLMTWWWGLPTSSSHALIGGFAGAGVAHAGWSVLRWDKLTDTLKFIFIAPVLGFALGFLLMLGVYWLFRRWRPAKVDRRFRR